MDYKKISEVSEKIYEKEEELEEFRNFADLEGNDKVEISFCGKVFNPDKNQYLQQDLVKIELKGESALGILNDTKIALFGELEAEKEKLLHLIGK